MLTVLEIVRHVYWNDSMYERKFLPPEAQLEKCTATLTDLSTMTGLERVAVLRECGVHSSLHPVFLRALQHLTAIHASGSIDDSYMIHRRLSAHQWSPFLATRPLLGYPFANSGFFPSEILESRRTRSKGQSISNGGNGKPTLPYNGLLNQGATCYLNSLLQALFHISEFRLTIYQMPTFEESEKKSDMNIKRTKSIPYALQRLFCLLQTGHGAVDTTELTESFGWSSTDGFIQHDVHELTCELLDNLENKLRNVSSSNQGPEKPLSSNDNAISKLFVGVLENFVRVDEAGYYGAQEELFYDLQLVVKHTNNIYASFDRFFQIEVLDGKNKYCLEHEGSKTYHRAEKGVRLKRTPLIMLLHLARFDYDIERGETKVLSRWDYYSTLDLSPYMTHAMNDETHYTLCSVLVHSGSNTGFGHYFCFLKCSEKWYRFNDEVVSSASLREVFGDNFGGYKLNYWGSEVPSSTSAYMLVYIRTSEIKNLLRPLGPDDVPRHVTLQLEEERKEYECRLKEEAEDHLYGRIHFIVPQDIVENHEFLSTRRPSGRQFPLQRTFRVLRSLEALPEFTFFVEQSLDVPASDQLLWYASARNGCDRIRLHSCVLPKMTVADVLCGEKECCVLVTGPSDTIHIDTVENDDNDDVEGIQYDLIHHKLYLPLQLKVVFLGCTVLSRKKSVHSDTAIKMMESIIRKLILKLPIDPNSKLKNHHLPRVHSKGTIIEDADLAPTLSIEAPSPDPCAFLFSDLTERPERTLSVLSEGEYQDYTSCAQYLQSGDILVWQEETSEEDKCDIFYDDIVSFQNFLKHLMPLEIKLNLPPTYPTLVETMMAEDMTYEQLQRYVARLIGDPRNYDRIRFTMQNPETKLPYFMKGRKKDRPTLGKLLCPATPRFNSFSKFLYYEYCKYTVTQIEAAHSLQFKLFNEHVKPLSEHWILMPRESPITPKELFSICVNEIHQDYAKGRRASLSISSAPTTAILTRSEKECNECDWQTFMEIEPEDAWKVLRLVDVWRGRIYNVFDKDHSEIFSHTTFEESAEYRIERIPEPLTDVPLERQSIIQVHHFTVVRQRANPIETHGEPFSLYIAHDEFSPELLRRIALKLGLSEAAVVDWKVALVREHHMVEVLPEVPIGGQLYSFCDEIHYKPNRQHPRKMAFLGLEHAPLSKRSMNKEGKVMIFN